MGASALRFLGATVSRGVHQGLASVLNPFGLLPGNKGTELHR